MRIHRFGLTALAATAFLVVGALAGTSLLAQQPAPAQSTPAQPPAPPPLAPPKPYKPVTIKLPTPVADPTFVAFRKQMGDIAQKKDRAALAKLVAQSFFFVNGEKDTADKKKPGIDNLAKALGLDGKEGVAGWNTLGEYAKEPPPSPMKSTKAWSAPPPIQPSTRMPPRRWPKDNPDRSGRLGLSGQGRRRSPFGRQAGRTGHRQARSLSGPGLSGRFACRRGPGARLHPRRAAVRQARLRGRRPAAFARQRAVVLHQGREWLEDRRLHHPIGPIGPPDGASIVIRSDLQTRGLDPRMCFL